MSELAEMIASQPLLILAIGSILIAMAGWQMQHSSPVRARTLRNVGYVGMAAALMLIVGLTAFRTDKSDAALAAMRRPELLVRGHETSIPLDVDGHLWVEAMVNGKPMDFMIDTGATYTSLSGDSARVLGLKATPGAMPAEFDTANGSAIGYFTRMGSLEFGSIRARDIDAVIMADDDGNTNVIGMNLLSGLRSWRAENGTLTLVPNNPVKR